MKKILLLSLIIQFVSLTAFSQQSSGPLVVVDGKIRYVDVHSIDGQTIESVTVLKDKEAIFAYGEAGRNGVVLVTTNSPAPVQPENAEPKPLLIIDDKVSYEEINSVSPANIESVTVLKGLQANNLWGEAGKDGVIIVKLKHTNL